jgi:hypothetical protein
MKVLVIWIVLIAYLPLYAEIKEPKTGIIFQETLSQEGKDLKLAGTGVRTRFVVKVYAAGLYIDDTVLRDVSGFDPARPSQQMFDAISNSEGTRAFVLKFARDVDAGSIVNAFEEGLKKSIDLKSPDISVDAQKFLSASKVDMKEGQELAIHLNGEEIQVVSPSAKGELVKNKKLSAAIAGIWLGKNPISDDLKKGLVNRLLKIK